MLPLYLLAGVDARRARQTNTSRAITIEKLALGALNLVETDHTPGGGIGTVGWIQPRIEKPECSFMVKGIDVDAFNNIGIRDTWTLSGAYIEKKTGIPVNGRAVIEGAIRSWEPDESSPTEFQGCNHTFAEITHYEFLLDGKELWYWDIWERVFRSNGVDHFAPIRQALGA